MDSHPETMPLFQLRLPANPPDRSRSGIARRVSRVAARARLESVLRSIATELLGPNESDELPGACAEWVAATTHAALSGISEAALGKLVEALDSFLVDAPPDIARRLDDERIRHDAGID